MDDVVTSSALVPGEAESSHRPMNGAVHRNGTARDRKGRGSRPHGTRSSPIDIPASLPVEESLRACRAIDDRCVFIFGPGRSGTTILAQLINAHDRAYLTTEAFFHMAGDRRPFRDRYNAQHRAFANQVCKSTYAPDFGSSAHGSWWEWLSGAAEHYDLVGDKLAFTYHHFDLPDAHRLQPFHESHFYRSRYLFVFRDPVQTLLGSAVLGYTEAHPLIRGWCEMVMLWADMIRIFPSTMTVLLEDLDADKVDQIGAFLGLDLSGSARLLDRREQRVHRPQDIEWGEAVTRVSPLLNAIYGEIRDTISMDRVSLQADQKRGLPGGPSGGPSSNIAVVSTPVGRAWNLADYLATQLRRMQLAGSNVPAPASVP